MNLNHFFKYLHLGLAEDILRLKSYGNFKEAIDLIDKDLESDKHSKAIKNSLIVQREIINRLAENYPYTKVEAIKKFNHI